MSRLFKNHLLAEVDPLRAPEDVLARVIPKKISSPQIEEANNGSLTLAILVPRWGLHQRCKKWLHNPAASGS